MTLKTRKDIEKTAKTTNIKKAVESFDSFFGKQYGERWPALRAAMAKPSHKVAMWNKFCKLQDTEADRLGLERVDGVSLQVFKAKPSSSTAATAVLATENAVGEDAAPALTLVGDEESMIDKPLHDELGTPAYYLLDLASTLIVENLQVAGHHRVLDLCAAPGGKSIAICQQLMPASGDIVCNEPNRERAARLKRNLHDFLPINTINHSVTQRDGTVWHQPNAFDRVLLDAPCSGERHLLQQPPSVMATWSPAYTEGMAATQLTLLLRALETAKVGGRIVYSTCSISNVENDDVVRQALAKTRCDVKPARTVLPIGEATRYGWIVLPDTAEGWGPMYCAALEKVGDRRSQSDSDDSDDDEESDEKSD